MPLALQTLTAPVIDTRLAALEARMSHFLPPDHDEIRALLADADRLARRDALEASHLRGRIHTLTGDRQQVDYWFANARRLHDDWRAAFNHASCLASLGYFSDAAALTSRFLNIDTGTLASTVSLAVIVLDLEGAVGAYDALRRSSLEPGGLDPCFAPLALEVLRGYELPVHRARSALDIMGQVLREERLRWIGPAPRLFAHCDQDFASVLYELRLPVSIDASIALSNRLHLRLFDAGLLLQGFVMDFVGTDPMPPAQVQNAALIRVV
ncbi:hypothetical protein ACNI65_10870 [Roseateles sp. So40a]|uniref:hypothetical protein n=1 Tax=Roseateles sp. So40a TaxID=3400226 RepID=UPI003A859AF2